MSTRQPIAASAVCFGVFIGLLHLSGVSPVQAQDGNENWAAAFGEPGVGTGAREAAVAGGDLYVVLPGNGAMRLAIWDGAGWRIVSSVSLAGGINDIAAVGTDVFIGGTFTSVNGESINRVARWNGSVWQPLGDGVNGNVAALASDGQNLYVGGTFTEAGGVSVRNIARWNGAEWSALTNGPGSSEGVNGPVAAIVTGNSLVYVGGGFTEAGQQAATSVASWNPTTGQWAPLGGGIRQTGFPYAAIRDLGVAGNLVYAAGSIDAGVNDGGEVAIGNVAVFDGNEWASLGTGSDIDVGAMLVSPGGEVFASGDFGTGTLRQEGVARWTGGAWERLAPAAYGGEVQDIVWYDGAMVAVAQGDAFGSLRTNGIASWSGSDWTGLGHGIDGPVLSFVEHDGALYAGGNFNVAGDTQIRSLARWSEDGWSAVGDGLPVNNQLLQVTALESTSAGLVAAGDFDEIGGVSVTNVALWDGSSWNDMGGGLTNFGFTPSVNHLQEMDGQLYAGGSFFNSNGTTVRGLARWTGSAWKAVGGGVQEVETFAAADGRIVVGARLAGLSTDYGPDGNGAPTERENVVLWDGNSWMGVGGGVDGMVLALAFDGSDIIVGGSFGQAGGVTANNIARWNGSAWSALGDGVNDAVHAIHVNGTDIWIGGDFTEASGTAAGGVARWDGSAWSAMGTGLIDQTTLDTVPAQVRAVVGTESGLFVGGTFTRAGVFTSENIALWTDYDLVGVSVVGRAEFPEHGLTLLGNYPNPFARSTTIRFDTDSATEISLQVYDILGRTVSLSLPLTHVGVGRHDLHVDASDLAPGAYFYRLDSKSRTVSGQFQVIR